MSDMTERWREVRKDGALVTKWLGAVALAVAALAEAATQRPLTLLVLALATTVPLAFLGPSRPP